ncbi:hypothetical protein [uncultured Treponema sp.]|uniref:hypothetical protein n=1 Tax=uncultured Treponema sp. TaxID=162155 RepID=UPI0025CBC1A6|nr:hypothetical protein [uncultured Treponema sp.]
MSFFSLSSAFSERVISPVKGRFANRQCLVLDLSDGTEAFYSYTNTDPLNSGFAYDSPVLIDMSGPVSLRISVVKGDGKSLSVIENYEINYTVDETGNPFAEGTPEKAFINRIMTENVLQCSSEQVIQVPKSFAFRVGDGEKPGLFGETLSVCADNKLSRYIPCSVDDGNNLWRFIVYVSGGESGSFSREYVPFEITDWETFRFTGKNLIWCIDDGIWSASVDEQFIDRSIEHTVYWQDVAYETGNEIHSFILPQKPSLISNVFDKAVFFSLDGDFRYRLKISSSGTSGQSISDSGLFSSLSFDTIPGDYIDSTAVFAVYCDGVYQGELSSPYVIDRQPPLPPKFIASEPGEYARHDVSLSIEAEKDAKIFICILGPFDVNSNSYLDNNSQFDFMKPKAQDYILYDKNPFELRAGIEKTVCYRAFAYCEDFYGNVSAVSDYKVIIDEFNYFIDGSASGFSADGSRLRPYKSFEQAVKVINEGKFVHFFVSGEVLLPKGASVISSNCSFTGMSDAHFILQPASYIVVQDASIEMQNCVIQKILEDNSSSDQRMFVFERSAASFEDCEILGKFSDSGTAISSNASIVTFKKSGLTSQSPVYSCCFSAINSRLHLEGSHFSSVSETAVNFSMKGGSLEMNKCDCKVISHLGRILESSGANLKLNSNKFVGEFDHESKGVNAIWKDEKSLIIEDINNISEGF